MVFIFNFSELRLSRHRVLELVSDPNHEMDTIDKAVKEYLALLQGFVVSFDDKNPGDSKLRHIIKFRWTNTLCGNTAV